MSFTQKIRQLLRIVFDEINRDEVLFDDVIYKMVNDVVLSIVRS